MALVFLTLLDNLELSSTVHAKPLPVKSSVFEFGARWRHACDLHWQGLKTDYRQEEDMVDSRTEDALFPFKCGQEFLSAWHAWIVRPFQASTARVEVILPQSTERQSFLVVWPEVPIAGERKESHTFDISPSKRKQRKYSCLPHPPIHRSSSHIDRV